MAKQYLNLDVNRAEGDLEVKVEYENGQVSDAWFSGTMFRGFEEILKGRDYRDSLVITPRICGICGTAHLYSAVTAIESALQLPVAPNGTRVRNICLISEEIQSDSRHAFLMFTIDFCNERYAQHKLYPALVELFAPISGRIYQETVVHTKKLLEIVALFGGQWPHSSYMVPGGVTTPPSLKQIVQSIAIVDDYIRWYESSILGCSLETWLSLSSAHDFQLWMNSSVSHKMSPVGLFSRFGRSIHLQKLGRGSGHLLSFGNYFDPEKWVPPYEKRHCLRPGGFHNAESGEVEPLQPEGIEEHVKHSWFSDYEGGRHPFRGETVPRHSDQSRKYSWAKAPRYHGYVVETGALAELVVAGDPLITDFFRREGANAWLRQFARFHRPVHSLKLLRGMLMELKDSMDLPFLQSPPAGIETSGRGIGLINAARGSLGHWVSIQNGKIDRYQIITPTAWNASPRDFKDLRGHMEGALLNTPVSDPENPVEIGHVIRSHDPCLVCTVHMVRTK